VNIPQTSYSQYFTTAMLGMQAYATETVRKISRIAKGIIYYGRAVFESTLYPGVCRLGRLNKFTITVSGTTIAAGSVKSVITHGYLKNGEVDASNSVTTVETDFDTNKNTTLAAHAADIAAAMEDCVTCVYGTTIVYTGDCEDIISVVTTFENPGQYDDLAASVAYTTADTAKNMLGISYLDHNRQQQIDGSTYFADTEPALIMSMGTVWVYSPESVTAKSSVYASVYGLSTDYSGYISDTTATNRVEIPYGAKFQENLDGAGLVPLTVNLPY